MQLTEQQKENGVSNLQVQMALFAVECARLAHRMGLPREVSVAVWKIIGNLDPNTQPSVEALSAEFQAVAPSLLEVLTARLDKIEAEKQEHSYSDVARDGRFD